MILLWFHQPKGLPTPALVSARLEVRLWMWDSVGPSPWLTDDGLQRLRQVVRGHLVEVQGDGGSAAAQPGHVVGLVGKQRDSNHRHGVIERLVQAVGTAVRHKRSRLWVT